MLILLSPAKTLDESRPTRALPASQPAFLAEAARLNQLLRNYDATSLAALMDISPKLAELNVTRNHRFALPLTSEHAKPSILCFKGDVYTDIRVDAYSDEELAFLNQHVGILSGLYGLLRPFDWMLPYRLEMGTTLPGEHGKNLYQFWDTRITKHIQQILALHPVPVVINLASTEYSKVLQWDFPCITPVFKESKNGKLSVVGLFAKRARGAMTDYMVTQRISDPEQLKGFTQGGYRYTPELSSAWEWVFVRQGF
jgi:cytoplasmic iron level regulating protein YaaA (DUF328/UPF0246 family)